MPEFYTITLEEHQRILQLCSDLKNQLDELQQSTSTLTDWLSMEDARKMFKNAGSSVSSSTFHKYVQTWIGNGTLIQNVHFKTVGTKIFIAAEVFKTPKQTGVLTWSKTG